MWNFSERPVQLRMVLFISGFVLFATTIGVVVILTRFSGPASLPVSSPVPVIDPSQQADLTLFVPVNEISSLLQPCLFTFQHSCASAAEVSKIKAEADPAPNVLIPTNTAYEPVAIQDLFAVLSFTPNQGLAQYQVPLEKSQLLKFFPEQKLTASASANLPTSMPAPLVLARVGAIYNLNPRLLLALTEVVNQGHGPIMSGTHDYSTPYFSTSNGFMAQLLQVATELQASESKYLGQVQDKLTPNFLTFFDKKYVVTKNTNPESLALATFLATHLPDKKAFETAIYQPTQPIAKDKSGLSQTQNFVFLYTLLFGTDPR